jgi:hypothetical protein
MGVELRRNHATLGHFWTRDIDALSVFIEAPRTGLRVHDVIDMDFALDPFGRRRHTQRGLVVRRADDGVAVMFVAENIGLFQALGEALLEDEEAAETALPVRATVA